MKAMVYEKSCIQCGLCASVCPEVFSMTPGAPARADAHNIPTGVQISARAAAQGCPTEAISIQ